ncbi:MAG: DedA family protein [Nanoarchaeota archaeon]|nr:DedA family protein [Nanoarchaeota archaeon]
MNFINIAIDFVLHIDKYVSIMINFFGLFTYGILFLIIFLETGLVIMPFLPGDSLIFVSGAFASQGDLNIFILYIVFVLAAIIGDSVNYFLGNYFGPRLFKNNFLFKEEYLGKTEKFYDKYGSKTIILARFIPIIRTFAPFVAGIGKMNYKKFIIYNVLGGVLWVSLFLFGGYFLGSVPIVKDNLTIFIFIIIIVSIIPAIVEYFRQKNKN